MGKMEVLLLGQYDPKALGADCDNCMLKLMHCYDPVPPEYHDKSVASVVSDFPRKTDLDTRRPLTGAHGMEFNTHLTKIGVKRTQVDLHHAVACMPPEADLEKVMLKWQRMNKQRVKAGDAPLPSPIEACRTRLLVELEHPNVISLGKVPFQSLTQRNKPVFDIRGGPVSGAFDQTGDYVTTDKPLDMGKTANILPTLHPGFVQHSRRWTKAFQSDLSRAFRWFSGHLGWRDPHIWTNPSPELLEKFLSSDSVPYVVDLETTFDDPLMAKLKCVGIGTEEQAVVIHLLSIEGPGGRLVEGNYYHSADELEIRAILRNFFADPNKLKAGHNCLYAGTPVILGDGTSEPVEALVRRKYAGEVMALDSSGRVVRARVTDWFRKREPGQEWLVVRREGEKKGARGLTLTPDHEVYTQRGRVRADQLVAGADFILSGEPRITRDEYDAMLGSLLGDSTVATFSNNKRVPKEDAVTGVFRGSHTPGGLAYEKARWLNGLLHLSESVQAGGFKPGQKVTAYRTDSMRQVADMARLVYDKSGKRRLRREVLDRLGPVGFAWLFADDGFKHSRPDRDNESVLLATCGFPETDILEAADWFTLRFGPTTVTKEGSLRLGVDATRAFVQHIAPYLLPAVRYKLPKGEWPEFVGFPEPAAREPHTVRIESVKKFLPESATASQKAAAETRWCIQTTEGNFLTGFGFVKNCGYFDSMVIKKHFGVYPKPMLDTILLHRSVESELPHRLGYVGSVYTDVTSWKEAHTAQTAGTDKELGHYCAIDCCVTARALPKLAEAAQLRQQSGIVQFDHRIQEVCVGLHETGMFIDLDRREQESARLQEGMKTWSHHARGAAARPDMNLNSTMQLRDLLFTDWKLAPTDYTKLGDPSTSDEALRLLRTANRQNDQVCNFIDALRKYRRVSKEFGTYVKRLVPYTGGVQLFAADDFDENEDGELDVADSSHADTAANKKRRGLILPDGRVHPDYNAHGTTSGRLSSSNPNAQNWPKHLRGMVIPQPGNIIVGADADQLELRIIASIAGIARYLEVFERGGDPHAETAAMMFGKTFTDLVPKSDQWDKIRKIAKGIKYASFYGSGDETVHNLVTSAEDEDGKLLYPDLSLREVSKLRRNWLKNIPELQKWWDDTLDQYRNTGYILDPVLGRRRDFLDGEAFNEIVNFPIQSAGAHIIHEGTFDLLNEIPFQKWGPGTGLIAQVHDALYVECPESEQDWVAGAIKEAMNRSVPGLPGVIFSAKPKAGMRWSDV